MFAQRGSGPEHNNWTKNQEWRINSTTDATLLKRKGGMIDLIIFGFHTQEIFMDIIHHHNLIFFMNQTITFTFLLVILLLHGAFTGNFSWSFLGHLFSCCFLFLRDTDFPQKEHWTLIHLLRLWLAVCLERCRLYKKCSPQYLHLNMFFFLKNNKICYF